MSGDCEIGDIVASDRYLQINRITKKPTGRPATFVVVGFDHDGSPQLWPRPVTSGHFQWCIEK